MIIKAGYLLLFFLFILPPSSVLAWSGKVIGVADGDTIKVLHNNEPVRIRLYGIDTPEKRQAFGNRAKKYTNAWVRGKVVEIDPVTKDRYGRTVAMVHVTRKNLNELLVQQGLAWVYRKYCKMDICENWYQYEDQARSSKKGLWRDPHAIPPWQWRKEKRQKHKRSKP